MPTRYFAASLGLVLAACSSSHGSPPCEDVEGTFELTVTGTGQSEPAGGMCPGSDTMQVIDVTLSHGQVSLNGETCALCGSVGCNVDVVCGDSVTCPGTVTPPASPPDSYVQTLTFVVPGADASTGNATVSLGANYCGYEGTAALKSP
jgi:hypothetical protein